MSLKRASKQRKMLRFATRWSSSKIILFKVALVSSTSLTSRCKIAQDISNKMQFLKLVIMKSHSKTKSWSIINKPFSADKESIRMWTRMASRIAIRTQRQIRVWSRKASQENQVSRERCPRRPKPQAPKIQQRSTQTPSTSLTAQQPRKHPSSEHQRVNLVRAASSSARYNYSIRILTWSQS